MSVSVLLLSSNYIMDVSMTDIFSFCETQKIQLSLLFTPCQQLDQRKRVAKNVFESKSQDRRTVKRPRFRQMKDAENHSRLLKVNS
jgi:hypothetical protein